MKRLKWFPLVFILLMAVPVFSQTEEELDKEILSDTAPAAQQSEADLDSQILSDQQGTGAKGPGLGKGRWECFGFIENVNNFGMPFTDDIDDYELVKAEIRNRLNVKYGINELYGKVVLDTWLYCHRFDEKDITRMGFVDAQEVFLGGGKSWFQFKLGKQLFSWGTGDAFQVTDYLDQADIRQFFAIDKDDRYRGVWALSMKFLIGDYAIETAVTPVHAPVLLPYHDSFWAMNFEKTGPIDTRYSRSYTGELNLEKTSFVVRGGGTAGAFDFHLSYFNGMCNIMIMKPTLKGSAVYYSATPFTVDPSASYIHLQPYYDRVNSLGFDCAFTIEKLSVRMEMLFTPDMYAIRKPDQDQVMQSIIDSMMAAMPLTPGQSFSTTSDFVSMKQVPYLAYVIGADYNLWGENGRILVEWVHGVYLIDDYDTYMEPMMTKILVMRVEDKLVDERLELELGCIMRPDNKEPGWALTGEIGWDFKNGLSIALGGYGFFGNDDDLFKLLDNKDMIYTRVRYEY